MKASNQWILLLSLLSFIFTMVAGFNILRDIAIIDRVGIGLLIVAVIQTIIAIIAVTTGSEKDEKQKHKVPDND